MKKLFPTAAATLLLVLPILAGICVAYDQKETSEVVLLPGDLVFQDTRSPQSRIIRSITDSPYSHVGVIFRREGRLHVFEAYGPVKSTPLTDWVRRDEGRFAIRRLKRREELLDAEALAALEKLGQAWLGKPYDPQFRWDDEKLYCSELVWKLFREGLEIELAELERWEDYPLRNERVQALVRERWGEENPRGKLISPAALFVSPILESL